MEESFRFLLVSYALTPTLSQRERAYQILGALDVAPQPGSVDESQLAASDFFETGVYVSHAT